MKKYRIKVALALVIGLFWFSSHTFAKEMPTTEIKESSAPDNEYIDWRLLSVSHRNDKKTLRAILGNDIAIKATREKKTQPWTDGAVIAKLIWKERNHPNWGAAIIPGDFFAAEAMIKDSKKYASTGGWGFGHWVKGKLEMHSEEKSKTCFGCHTAVKDNDYVFTFSVPLTP